MAIPAVLGPIISGIGSAFSGVRSAASQAAGALQSAFSRLPAIGSLIDRISGLFNVQSATLYKNVLNDINGVIGNALVPVSRIFIGVARMVGDALATVAPAFFAVFGRLEAGINSVKPALVQIQSILIGLGFAGAEFLNVAIDLAKAIWGFIAPMIGVQDTSATLTSALDMVAKALIGAAVSGKVFVDQARRWFRGEEIQSFDEIWSRILNETEAIWNKAKSERRSSVGQGNYGASYMDLSAFDRKIRESAFSMAGPSLQEKREETNTKNIQDIAVNLKALIAKNETELREGRVREQRRERVANVVRTAALGGVGFGLGQAVKNMIEGR